MLVCGVEAKASLGCRVLGCEFEVFFCRSEVYLGCRFEVLYCGIKEAVTAFGFEKLVLGCGFEAVLL